MFEANERAVAEALVHYLAGDVRSGVWPFEIITIGGDDVLAFVPAHRALEIALSIAEHFEQDMQGTGISLSVGVMLMPDATPVRFARELVEQLLKSAKKRSKQQHIGSTIDFLSLKGTTMIAETIERYRSATFLREDRTAVTAKPRPSLTQRPYSVEELRRLIAACRELKRSGFPRSQLYQLREIVMDGQLLQSMIDYRYFVGRGTSQAYEAFEREMERLCDDERWLPWRSRQEQKGVIYDTPLLDLIEIYPFVEAGGEA
ncbi:MAG: hypothetical protein KatS3mg057_1160 [Herpetosiphonaceae bacterium]|nr:MAG: hypothetical protein KatS3mg057_1160 [Herpetosiphonaceae bacterium]